MIRICFITDKKYVKATMCAVLSVIQNCKKDSEIYVLCSNVSNRSKNLIKKLETKNCKIKVTDIENPLKEYDFKHKHVSGAALIKFNLPDIFNDFDKILYLDSDVLVLKDLSEFFETDLKDSYALVVSDMLAYKRNLHIDLGLNNYFNSGVMLLNLKKMREDGIVSKLKENKIHEVRNLFMDQDVFNSVFRENIIFESPDYNYMEGNLKDFSDTEISNFYRLTEKQLAEIKKEPHIFHFTYKRKPWNTAVKSSFKRYLPYITELPCLCVKIQMFFRILFNTLFDFVILGVKSIVTVLGLKQFFKKLLSK